MDEHELEMEEERGRGGRRSRGRPPPRAAGGRRRRRPWVFGPWGASEPIATVAEPAPVEAAPQEPPTPTDAAPEEGDEEVSPAGDPYTRWVQAELNRILGFRLVVDGVNGAATRSAVRSFQLQQALTVDGVVGPRTEAALVRAGARQPPTRAASTCAHPLVHSVLPASGPGFYSYSTAAKQFAVPEVIRALVQIAGRWNAAHPEGPRIAVGDISQRCGGRFAPHGAHRRGLEVDLRPMRADGSERGVMWSDRSYSRWLTQQLVELVRANGVLRVRSILFNDPGVQGVSPYPKHDDHLHVHFEALTGSALEFEAAHVARPGHAVIDRVVETLSWTEAVDPGEVIDGPGVYIIERSRDPVYVGESDRLRLRVRESLVALKSKLGVGGTYKVRVGTFTSGADAKVRAQVEHAIIRSLKVMGHRLENRSSVRPFRVGHLVDIKRVVPYTIDAARMPLTPAGLKLSAMPGGTWFELGGSAP